MASLVTIRNDGPDVLEVRLAGKRRLLIRPGEEIRVNCTVAMEPVALPPIKDEMHQRYVEPAQHVEP